MKNTLKTKQNKNPTLPRGPLVHQGLQTRRCGHELGGQPASRARVGGASADPALASLGRRPVPIGIAGRRAATEPGQSRLGWSEAGGAAAAP